MAATKKFVDLIFRAFDRASPTIRKLEGQLARTNKQMRGLQRSGGKAGAGLKSFRIGAGGAAAAMIALKIAVLAAAAALLYKLAQGLAVSFEQAVAFEKQMAKVNTMLDEGSEKMLPGYAKAMDLMSRQFGQSTATISKGLYDILSAAIAPEDALKVLEVALIASTGGMVQTEIAADALTTVMNSYMLSAERAAEVSDVMFKMVKRGKMDYAQLAAGIGNVSAMAFTAGVSLTDLGAGVATMTRSGLKADIAFVAMRTVLGSMLKPSAEAQKELKKLGIEFSSSALRAKGLAGIVEELARATPEQLARMFPKRGMVGISAMINDLKGLKRDIREMTGAAGASGEAFEKMAGTSAFQIDQLKQEFFSLAREIGEDMLPIGIALMEFARDQLIPWLREWGKWLNDLVGGFDKLINKFSDLWGSWRNTVAKVFFEFSVYWESLPEIIELMTVKAGLAIVSFAEDLAHEFKHIGKLLTYLWDNWKEVFQTMLNFVTTVATNIGKNLANLWTAMKGFFKGEGFKFDWKGLTEDFEASLKKLPEMVKRSLSETEKELTKDIDALGTSLAETWEKSIREGFKLIDIMVPIRKGPGTPAFILTPTNVGPEGIVIPGALGHPGAGGVAGGGGGTGRDTRYGSRFLTSARHVALGMRQAAAERVMAAERNRFLQVIATEAKKQTIRLERLERIQELYKSGFGITIWTNH